VKLSVPADRIGQGLVAVVTYPAGHLSPCSDSDSNPGGFRQALSAELMHGHQAMATAKPPAGPVGHSVPGSQARRRTPSFARSWQTMKPSLQSRESFPAALSERERIGDCQSSDRRDARQAAMSWGTNPIAAAAI
jgi:hypothetical protein